MDACHNLRVIRTSNVMRQFARDRRLGIGCELHSPIRLHLSSRSCRPSTRSRRSHILHSLPSTLPSSLPSNSLRFSQQWASYQARHDIKICNCSPYLRAPPTFKKHLKIKLTRHSAPSLASAQIIGLQGIQHVSVQKKIQFVHSKSCLRATKQSE